MHWEGDLFVSGGGISKAQEGRFLFFQVRGSVCLVRGNFFLSSERGSLESNEWFFLSGGGISLFWGEDHFVCGVRSSCFRRGISSSQEV